MDLSCNLSCAGEFTFTSVHGRENIYSRENAAVKVGLEKKCGELFLLPRTIKFAGCVMYKTRVSA